jgi:MarR family transcriptional regulator, organic hydroperoxide resistance regulator
MLSAHACIKSSIAGNFCGYKYCRSLAIRPIRPQYLELSLYRLTHSLPYLLNRVGVRIGELFSLRIERYGVSLPMYRVLAALHERPNQRLSDLSEMTTAEISTLSRLIGQMKRKGWVSRRRLEDNGRTVEIKLTEKGRALTEELIPIAVHFEDVAVGKRSAGEVKLLKQQLADAYEALNEIQKELILLQEQGGRKRSSPTV